jgi:class 3 adenylate cyclase
MKSDDVKRALTAIVMADVVGYSRMMGQDDRAALARMKSVRAELVNPLVAAHRGHIVDSAGDSLLIEFASVVDALEAAISLQQALARRNVALAAPERLEYRVGVHLGDVIVERGALYGDGVNVAARLQAMAAPGGICLSRAVHEQVVGRLDLGAEALGPQTLKNIVRPVEVYALSPEAVAALPPRAAPQAARSRRPLMAAAAVVLALAAGAALYLSAPRPAGPEAALAAREPGLSAERRARLVADYLAAKPHRAFVFAPRAATHWWSADWPSAEVAEQKALERCQMRFGEPCLVVIVDDVIAATRDAAPRDMPGVTYAGSFDPARLPGLRAAVAARADIAGYLAAPPPKAAAIHPHGVFTVATGAPSQHAAEARALKACNDDDSARDADGPCFLYAIGDEVVLPRRLTAPLTPK